MDLLERSRAIVLARASGMCEGCMVSATAGTGLDVHHRQARGSGGVHGAAADIANDPRNLLALCRADCHARTEDGDEWAACLAVGWRVRHAHQGDARRVPALLHTVNGTGWWLLTRDGGYVRVDWPAEYRLDSDDLAGETWFAEVDPAVIDLL